MKKLNLLPESFFNKPLDERVKFLKANADQIQEESVFEPVDGDERAELDHKVSELSLEQYQIEQEKKEMLDHFKEQLKPVKESLKAALETVNNGGSHVIKPVYKFQDHESGMMISVDENGAVVQERRLFESEKQTTLQGGLRSVANNE